MVDSTTNKFWNRGNFQKQYVISWVERGASCWKKKKPTHAAVQAHLKVTLWKDPGLKINANSPRNYHAIIKVKGSTPSKQRTRVAPFPFQKVKDARSWSKSSASEELKLSRRSCGLVLGMADRMPGCDKLNCFLLLYGKSKGKEGSLPPAREPKVFCTVLIYYKLISTVWANRWVQIWWTQNEQCRALLLWTIKIRYAWHVNRSREFIIQNPFQDQPHSLYAWWHNLIFSFPS